MSETILYRRRGAIAELTLNCPERHNSLGRRELDGIHTALTAVSEDDEVRVLVVSGAGDKTFCAGASLREMESGEISGDDYQAMTDMVAALSIPTVCGLNGNAFGGGVELALSCDFRIGVEGSRMRVPAAAIGLCYPRAGIEKIVSKLGITMAKRLLIAAETFSADEMLQNGVLDHLVMRAQFKEFVQHYAEQIAALAPLSVQAMKSLIAAAAAGPVDKALYEELARRCNESADLREGLAAVGEKRPAVFRGC